MGVAQTSLRVRPLWLRFALLPTPLLLAMPALSRHRPCRRRSPEYIEAQFLDTYRMFVPRDFTGQEKDVRWSRYYQGRWVRWSGQLRFVTSRSVSVSSPGSDEQL
jgi:hypothetical protein